MDRFLMLGDYADLQYSHSLGNTMEQEIPTHTGLMLIVGM